METPRHADLIIEARWIIPAEPANTTLARHSIVIGQGLIIDLLPTSEARIRYTAEEIRSLPNHVILPGLINAHARAALGVFRCLGLNLPREVREETLLQPLEQKLLSPRFVYETTLLAAAEMLRGGITCCANMYCFPDDAARAFSEAGMRALIGLPVRETAGPYAGSADQSLEKGLAARDAWLDQPLLDFALNPPGVHATSQQTLERICVLADELDCPIHMPACATEQSIQACLARYGIRPLARLRQFGLLGPALRLAHGTLLNEEELELAAHHNCGIIHTPTADMGCAAGIAPVAAMLSSGITPALGTDDGTGGCRLDIFQEMRQASLLARAASGDATLLPAHQAIRLATLHGAQILGLEKRIGAIVPGLEADLCALTLNGSGCEPDDDLASHVVYVLGRESISDVWVKGIACVQEGRLLLMGNIDLVTISRLWQNSAKPW